MIRLPKIFLSAFLLFAVSSPFARAEPTAPSVNEIVQKAVARDDALRKRRMEFKCDQIVKVERFDSDGKVTKTTTNRTVHTPGKDIEFKTDINSDSAKGDTAADAAKGQKIEAIMDLGKLASRFDMSLAGEESVRGKLCYIVRYTPKSSQPSATREEKVVNNLKGRFWISKEDYSILQSDGVLSSAVTVALIASVNTLNFQFHSQTLPNGDCGPANFSVYMTVKAPFYDFREKKSTVQENWRPR